LLIQAAVKAIERRRQQEALDSVLHARRILGVPPDPWQAATLRSAARQLIMLCSRQSGKSTVASILALHEAIYKPSALVLLLSPSLRQSQELFRKAKDSHNALLSAVPVEQESALQLTFENQSRIVALPGKESTIRGFSGVTLLVVDEASRVDDALYQAVRPMLAVSGGRLLLLSTPFGRRGFFHDVWENGGAAWDRTKVTAYDCPRISREWLEEERKQIGEWWFAQEYEVVFQDDVSAVFRYEDIIASMNNSIEPQWGIADALR
jgi:hypothetical protein